MSERLFKENDKIIFDDGQDIIDYVLVYTRKNLSNTEHTEYFTKLRKNFINFLVEKHKIQIKEQIIKTEKMEIGFYLLHLTWAVLIEEAERLKLKVPLRKLKAELRHEFNFKKKFSILKHFQHKMPSIVENNKKETFQKENIHKYHITKNKNIHFRTCQRQYIMKEILDSIVYKEDSFCRSKLTKILSWFHSYNRNENVRLKRLLNDGVLSSAFPLHDGNIDYSTFNYPSQKKDKNIDRQLLYDHWASWCCIFKFQPLDEIENYFGPKVSFYFAWLGFYTTWLFPMAILGILFFFFGNYDPSYEDVNNFVCGENSDEIIMCPLCTECTPWHLNDICMATQINRLFDNIFSVLFALMMNIWEFWKRHSKKLSHLWGVLDYERDEEKPSPDYCFFATKEKRNPITHELEPFFPRYLVLLRRVAGAAVLTLFVLIAIFFHFVIILLRLSIHHILFLTEGLRPFATLFSNILCGILNLGFIILFDKIYEKCAQKITRWEMFRTESKYEESLIVKLFIILAFNYYSHAFYIAFLKGRIKFHFINKTFIETVTLFESSAELIRIYSRLLQRLDLDEFSAERIYKTML
ncbi:anoctamin-7-like [Brachionus plicatilis]|uniref:Anoctamin n=1 Tax=Brachionus plicatilis TaxID=10195 RepID=A0A3M7RWG6_BRAPC|nr:anoctamin-7-like [Brachionus plicatilis]